MYLSRLILNPRSREVRRDLADCQALHARLMCAFPQVDGAKGSARAALGVLYRAESDPRSGLATVLVQSRSQPDWSRLPSGYLLQFGPDGPENPACKEVSAAYAALGPGDVLIFRLLANPTRKIATRSGPNGERRNGQRVELRGEEAWHQWLARKGEQGGFRVLSVRARPCSSAGDAPGEVPDARVTPRDKVVGYRDGGAEGTSQQKLTFGAVLFEGRLRIWHASARCWRAGSAAARRMALGSSHWRALGSSRDERPAPAPKGA